MHRIGQRKQRILIEPGRALVGNAGLLLSRVEYLKHSPHRNFAIVDAAMNDLMRPSLYDAPITKFCPLTAKNDGDVKTYQVVGPVCETGIFLGMTGSWPCLKETCLPSCPPEPMA